MADLTVHDLSLRADAASFSAQIGAGEITIREHHRLRRESGEVGVSEIAVGESALTPLLPGQPRV